MLHRRSHVSHWQNVKGVVVRRSCAHEASRINMKHCQLNIVPPKKKKQVADRLMEVDVTGAQRSALPCLGMVPFLFWKACTWTLSRLPEIFSMGFSIFDNDLDTLHRWMLCTVPWTQLPLCFQSRQGMDSGANLELKKTPACGYRCDPCSKSLWRSSVFSHHLISSHPSLQHSELVDGSSAEVWGIGGGIGLSCKGLWQNSPAAFAAKILNLGSWLLFTPMVLLKMLICSHGGVDWFSFPNTCQYQEVIQKDSKDMILSMYWALPKHCNSGFQRLIGFKMKRLFTYCFRLLATPNQYKSISYAHLVFTFCRACFKLLEPNQFTLSK